MELSVNGFIEGTLSCLIDQELLFLQILNDDIKTEVFTDRADFEN